MPSAAMRFQICSAINLVVHTERVTGGARKIVEISEVLRTPGEMEVQPIFWYEQTGVDANENATGIHRAAGTVPACVAKIRARGVEVDERIFARSAEPKKKAPAAPGRTKR